MLQGEYPDHEVARAAVGAEALHDGERWFVSDFAAQAAGALSRFLVVDSRSPVARGSYFDERLPCVLRLV